MTSPDRPSTDRNRETLVRNDRARRHVGDALPKFYSIKAVADSLNLSERTIRRWVARGTLAVHRVGNVVRVSERDLRIFLALHRDG